MRRIHLSDLVSMNTIAFVFFITGISEVLFFDAFPSSLHVMISDTTEILQKKQNLPIGHTPHTQMSTSSCSAIWQYSMTQSDQRPLRP